MEKIGIVTITFNSSKVIAPFFECVFKQSYKNFKLYIIDNGSSDNTLDLINDISDKRIVLIKNKKNFGVAKANNQGVKIAIEEKCKKIMFLNNDVEFEKDLIYKLVKFQKEKKCGLVAPKMMFFNNPKLIWYAGSWYNKKKGYLPLHRGINKIDKGQYDKIAQVEYAPTCCLLLDNKVFEDVGLMDEKYFVYFDDTDFLYRVLTISQHKLFYYPYVQFFHKVGSLTNSFNNDLGKVYRGSFFLKYNTRNHIYFLRKVGTVYSYIYILLLFPINNLKFFVKKDIKMSIKNWVLINRSYFNGFY